MPAPIPPDLLPITRILAPLIAASTAGSILSLSYFPLPIIRAVTADQSTARGLDHLKGLFSSGSHIFPPLAGAAASLYGLLAYAAPAASAHRTGYIIAAAGCIGIAPFTGVMVRAANQKLLDLAEKRGKAGGRESLEADKEEVLFLLKRFEWLNAVRAGIMASGAAVGLYTALVL